MLLTRRRAVLFAGVMFGLLFSKISEACNYLSKVDRRVGPNIIELDSCIADLVVALNKGGIKTKTSCCGHGKTDGYILCEDFLLIVSKERGKEAHARYHRDWDAIGENNEAETTILRRK